MTPRQPGIESLLVMEQKDTNGGAAVRELIDARFQANDGWAKEQTGGVDWTKCKTVNGTRVCLGVEIQVSARSDLLLIDIAHLRRALSHGVIDVGVIVVPSDRLAYFLTDRAPSASDAVRIVQEARAEYDIPLILMSIEHDGPGPALPKRRKRPSGERQAN